MHAISKLIYTGNRGLYLGTLEISIIVMKTLKKIFLHCTLTLEWGKIQPSWFWKMFA